MNKSVSLILLFFLCLFRCEWISASEEVSSVVAGEYGEFVVTDFGAVGNGVTDDARAIQQAIDACSAAGGGIVVFPAGKTFLAGPLHMRSNVNLHLRTNSVLLANPNESIYNESAFGANEGEGMMWLSGKDIRNFTISGTGRIDGNAVAFMGAELDDSFELKPVTTFDPRPHVLTLINARDRKSVV